MTRLIMDVPGFPTEAIDESREVYRGMVSVLAIDRSSLDILLKTKWNGMKVAMTEGNIEAAVQEFTYGQREIFRKIFTIQKDKLAEIANEMQEIELIYQTNNTA